MTASTIAPTTTSHATYRQVFSSRQFRALFTTSVFGVLAVSLQLLALSILVFQATGSAWLSAVAYGAVFLPQLVGGLFLTSLADRYSARLLITAGCLLRSGVALLLALPFIPPLWMVAVVASASTLQPVSTAAQSALVPRLLRGDEYVLGRSLFTLASAGSQLIGLGAGGMVIAAFGARDSLYLSVAMQLIAASVAVRLPAGTRTDRDGAVSRWRPGETWRHSAGLLRDRVVRRILLLWWLPPTLMVGAEALCVPYAAASGSDPATAGWLLASFPLGMFIGDLVVGRFCSPRQRERLVLPLLLMMGLALTPLACRPHIAVAVVLLGLASTGLAYQLGRQQAFLDAIGSRNHGIAFGLVSTGMMVGQGTGPVISGGVADVAGAGVAMTLAGVGIVTVAVLLARPPCLRTASARTR